MAWYWEHTSDLIWQRLWQRVNYFLRSAREHGHSEEQLMFMEESFSLRVERVYRRLLNRHPEWFGLAEPKSDSLHPEGL